MDNMVSRTRRGLLVTLATSGAGAVAGCLADLGEGDDANDDEANDTPASDAHYGGGGSPSPSLGGDDCPDYDTQEVVCYDAIESFDDLRGYLEPERQTMADGEAVEMRLRNESDQRLESNFDDWALHKRVDGSWYRIAPFRTDDQLGSVDPGTHHTWTFRVDEDGGHHYYSNVGEEVHHRSLGGGTYAFRARGWFEDDAFEEDTAFAATVDLEADPLVLEPSDIAGEPTWDGDTLVAESGREERESYRYATYEIERVDETDEEPWELVTEQVYRFEQLRNALAFAVEYDADRVRLEGYTGANPPFAPNPERPIEYERTIYDVTTEVVEGDGTDS